MKTKRKKKRRAEILAAKAAREAEAARLNTLDAETAAALCRAQAPAGGNEHGRGEGDIRTMCRARKATGNAVM